MQDSSLTARIQAQAPNQRRLPEAQHSPVVELLMDFDAEYEFIDNDGGGIFSFLPQANVPDGYETLYAHNSSVTVAANAPIPPSTGAAPVGSACPSRASTTAAKSA